jgi:hypothetical protein
MTTTTKQPNRGFVRIIVIIIVLLIIMTLTDFSMQDSFSIDSVITHAQNTWQKVTIFYQDVLQAPIQNYAQTPAERLHALIDSYIIDQLTNFLQTLTKTPPVW